MVLTRKMTLQFRPTQLRSRTKFLGKDVDYHDQAAFDSVITFLSSVTPSLVEDESLPRATSPTIVVLCCFWTMSR